MVKGSLYINSRVTSVPVKIHRGYLFRDNDQVKEIFLFIQLQPVLLDKSCNFLEYPVDRED